MHVVNCEPRGEVAISVRNGTVDGIMRSTEYVHCSSSSTDLLFKYNRDPR